MATVINRVTKQLIHSANTPDYPVDAWIINPDLSDVIDFDRKYWKIDADSVVLASDAEMASIDLAQSDDRKQSEIDSATDEKTATGALIMELFAKNDELALQIKNIKDALLGATTLASIRAAADVISIPEQKSIDQIKSDIKGRM